MDIDLITYALIFFFAVGAIYILIKIITLPIKLLNNWAYRDTTTPSRDIPIPDYYKDPTAHLPKLLENAKVFMNETQISTEKPFPLFGKVDQVFQLEDGSLVIMDTKYRQHQTVFSSDAAQLSVYALILAQKGYKVRDFGYIRFVDVNMIETYRATQLIHPRKLAALWNQYHTIRLNNLPVKCTCGRHDMSDRQYF